MHSLNNQRKIMKQNFLQKVKTLSLVTCLLAPATNLTAQYCIPAPLYGCITGDYPSSFMLVGTTSSINDPSMSCGMSGGMPLFGGYDDRTAETCAVASPGTYVATITSASASASEDCEIFVDFDNDGTFASSESVGGYSGVFATPVNFNVNIPSGIPTGDYRMRLAFGQPGPLGGGYPGMDPCFSGFTLFGEGVDYTLHVGVACTAPTVTLGAATCSTQVITWGAVSGASGYEYVLNTTAGSPTGPGTTIGASPYNASSLSAGTTYYFHLRTNCGGGSYSSWVNTPFTTTGPSAIVGNPATCPGTPTQLSSSPAGGAWTSSNTSAATVSGTGLVTGVASGVTWITYTQSGCSSTFSMTVGNMPPITGSTTLCPGGTSTLTNPIPGGTWSSSTPSVASVGASTGLVTAGSGSGTTVITYSNAGCSATVTVTVSPLPAITGGTTVCAGSTLALSNSTPGGTWSSSNASAATVVTSTGVVSGVAPGTTVIQYSLTGCSVTTTVTVGASIAAITGVSTFCVTGSTSLSTTTASGTWSSSNNAVATVNSTGTVGGVSAGTTTISYTAGGCSVTKVVTVDPNTVIISGPDSVCKGAGHEVTLSSNSAGGTWSSSHTARAVVDATLGVVTGMTSAQTFTVTYTVTNSCGTLTARKAMYVRSAAKCTTGFEAIENVIGDLKVFPNPNNGNFTINFTSDLNEDVQVVVTNIVGAKVKEFTMATNSKTDLQLSVPSGIYLISASSAHGTHVKKIVVER